MAQLIVRNLDEEVVRRLKLRAAQNGRSAEAEHRAILEAVLLERSSQSSLKQLLQSMPDVGEDTDFLLST
ncbi:FitA-like ribbon-helix-helix domain-containing protein [Brasilonema bromeliae]|uniref:DNA-binding protein n=1 Tax=Brasilonema bromeliae SPC951 TaxID=385972 RepID=A0ABX1PEI2_9CYAN|nr:DNA-binding protein [Brasilonema bromeliae]NMG22192.1 DNA-binding protein [Brasilonema bromeliae SPC951]